MHRAPNNAHWSLLPTEIDRATQPIVVFEKIIIIGLKTLNEPEESKRTLIQFDHAIIIV